MIDQLIAEIIQRESVKDTNNPNDSGGRTKYGISEKSNPQAWRLGPPTLEEAKAIYKESYFVTPGIVTLQPEYLLSHVADFGVLSGPGTAIQKLQDVLQVPSDGVLGPATLKALSTQNPETVNTKLVMARVLMLARIVQKNPKDLEFLFGWLSRALSFLRV